MEKYEKIEVIGDLFWTRKHNPQFIPEKGLQAAAEAGDCAEILRYLKAGVDINAHEYAFGKTPLFFAVLGEKPKAVKLLLDAGADANAALRDGTTPLHCAMGLEIWNLLLDAGADANARDMEGETPVLPQDEEE